MDVHFSFNGLVLRHYNKIRGKNFISTVSKAVKVQGLFYELFGYVGYYLKWDI